MSSAVTWASRFCSIDVDPLVPLDEARSPRRRRAGRGSGSTRWRCPRSRSRSRASTTAAVGAAVGDQADPGAGVALDDGARERPAGRLELAGQPVEVLLPVLGPLAVARLLVVAGAAGEVGRQRVLGAGDGPVADAVAVDVLVPLEAAQPLEVLGGRAPCRAGAASSG